MLTSFRLRQRDSNDDILELVETCKVGAVNKIPKVQPIVESEPGPLDLWEDAHVGVRSAVCARCISLSLLVVS